MDSWTSRSPSSLCRVRLCLSGKVLQHMTPCSARAELTAQADATRHAARCLVRCAGASLASDVGQGAGSYQGNATDGAAFVRDEDWNVTVLECNKVRAGDPLRGM